MNLHLLVSYIKISKNKKESESRTKLRVVIREKGFYNMTRSHLLVRKEKLISEVRS